jgi:hypothetical protein
MGRLVRPAVWGNGVGGVTDQLSLSAPADAARVQTQRDTLLAAARDLIGASGHDPDLAPCVAAGCRLADVADERVCAVAHRLATVAEGPIEPIGFELAWSRFLSAMTAASEAVGVCRRTAHPHGECWFSAVPDQDGCGAVLRLAHRIG